MLLIGNSGHIIFDTAEAQVITNLSVAMLASNVTDVQFRMLWHLLIHEHLNRNAFEMAYRFRFIQHQMQVKDTDGMHFTRTAKQKLFFFERIQRTFVLAHELAHVFASSSGETAILQDHVSSSLTLIAEGSLGLLPSADRTQVEAAINMARTDPALHDEIACDAVAVECIAVILRREGQTSLETSLSAAEAIHLCMVAQFFLRLVRSVAAGEFASSSFHLDQHWVRIMAASNQLAARFGVNQHKMAGLIQSLTSDHFREQMNKFVNASQSLCDLQVENDNYDWNREDVARRINELCGWNMTKNELFCSRIW
jgi:hypothetical protein